MNKKSCYAYLIDILNKKDFSSQELIYKATSKEYPVEEIDAAISLLTAQNYLNDKRLAENVIYFYSKIKGINWIKRKMQERKIPREMIEEVLQSDESEPDLREITKKTISKFRITSIDEIDHKLYAKIYRFLIYNGYNNAPSIIETLKENLSSSQK
jgi:SOS response regulatory protein OraA/RecX